MIGRKALWAVVGALILGGVALGLHLRDAALRRDLLRADPAALAGDARLYAYATERGKAVFAQHCAACHGAGGEGRIAGGIPDLRDGEHLYGEGRIDQIEQITRYGIRSHHSLGWNLASMPAYATAQPSADKAIRPLTPAQVSDLTQFVLGLGGRSRDGAAVERGKALFAGSGGCYDCHGADAAGDSAIGAPSLADAVWLYGGSAEQIRSSIEKGRAGVSPAFLHTLDAADIRAVSAFTFGLSRQDEHHGGR